MSNRVDQKSLENVASPKSLVPFKRAAEPSPAGVGAERSSFQSLKKEKAEARSSKCGSGFSRFLSAVWSVIIFVPKKLFNFCCGRNSKGVAPKQPRDSQSKAVVPRQAPAQQQVIPPSTEEILLDRVRQGTTKYLAFALTGSSKDSIEDGYIANNQLAIHGGNYNYAKQILIIPYRVTYMTSMRFGFFQRSLLKASSRGTELTEGSWVAGTDLSAREAYDTVEESLNKIDRARPNIDLLMSNLAKQLLELQNVPQEPQAVAAPAQARIELVEEDHKE